MKRFLKIVCWVIFSVVIALTALLMALPTIISTKWGTSQVLSIANQRIPGVFHADTIGLSWLSNQVISGITLQDPNDNYVADIKHIRIDASLFDLLFKDLHQQSIVIDSLNLKVTEYQAGLTNLHQALGSEILPHPFYKGASGAQPLEILLQDVNARLDISPTTTTLTAEGHTKQQELLGQFDIATVFDNSKEAQHPLKKLQVNIQNFPVRLADHFIAMKHPKLSGILELAVGNALDVSINQVNSDGKITINGTAVSANLQADFIGAIESDLLLLSSPATISLNITPELFHRFQVLQNIEPKFRLLNNVTAHTTITQFKLPLDDSFAGLPILEATLDIDKAFVQDFKTVLRFDLLNFHALVQTFDYSSNISFKGEAVVKQFDKPLSVSLNTTIHGDINKELLVGLAMDLDQNIQHPLGKFLGPKSHVTAHTTVQKKNSKEWQVLPINASLDSALGTFLVTADWNPPQHKLDVSFQGLDLKGNAALSISDFIRLQDTSHPITINGTLTPERFTALRSILNGELNQDTITLLEPATFHAAITDLSIARDFKSLMETPISIKGSLGIDALKIADGPQQLALKNLTMGIDAQDLSKSLSFYLEGKEIGQNGVSNPFTLKGAVADFLTGQRFNTQTLSLDLDAKSKRLPTDLLCRVWCIDAALRSKLEALLGQTIDTDIHVQVKNLQGVVIANLKGENGRISLNGQVVNKILTLNKPFEMEVKVTPQLAKSLLEEVLPILRGILSGEQPIRITIDPQGFSIPLKNIEISDIEIEHATIELGKILFSNEGELGTIFQLLRPSSQEPLSVWFTPLYLQMHKGKVIINRMDMLLLNRFPMAIWGNVNFPKDKIDIIIGISGYALSQSLNIQGLDSAYMMQIPLAGRLGKASIDKAKAAARISALMAQSHGSPQGFLIGTVLDIAGGSLSEDKPPSPTTNPLPWESLLKTKAKEKEASKKPVEEEKSEKKSSKKKGIKKVIEEAAYPLIDKLLG